MQSSSVSILVVAGALAAGVILSGCTQPDTPESVAEKFNARMLSGDSATIEKAIREMVAYETPDDPGLRTLLSTVPILASAGKLDLERCGSLARYEIKSVDYAADKLSAFVRGRYLYARTDTTPGCKGPEGTRVVNRDGVWMIASPRR